MNDFLKAQIDNMNVKSDEFWDLYKHVCNKYYTFDDPDAFQKSVMLAHMYLDKSCENYEENVIAMVEIIKALHGMDPLKGGSAIATLGFKEFLYTIKITSNPEEMDKMEEMIEKTHQGLKDGSIKISSKNGKKNPFGKKFF